MKENLILREYNMVWVNLLLLVEMSVWAIGRMDSCMECVGLSIAQEMYLKGSFNKENKLEMVLNILYL